MPAIGETVPGYEFIGWYGLVVPTKTPGEFRTFMVAHMEKMRNAVVASGARPE